MYFEDQLVDKWSWTRRQSLEEGWKALIQMDRDEDLGLHENYR